MALFDNGLRVGTGLAIGVGALLLAPAVLPVLAAVAKPLVKATLKSTLILYEKSRELIAETTEAIEDLAAEAKAELILSREQAAAAMSQDEGQ